MKHIAVTLLAIFISCAAVAQTSRAAAIAARMHDPRSEYVIVACHRGDWRNYPENSIPAIESVIRMGADIVEIDLKMTRDSVLVLSHDRTLNRCTTGKGEISSHTWDEIRGLRLKRAHNVATDTVHIPTLRQALSVCKDRICVNVDQGYEYYDQVLAIAEELGMTDQILIKGGKSIAEVEAREAAHEHNMMYMPIVDIEKKKGMDLFKSYIESGKMPIAFEVCWSSDDLLFSQVAGQIVARGAKLWVNTIWGSLCGGAGKDDDAAFAAKDPHEVYGRYLDAGVSMIQTDRPQLLIPYLESRGRHTL